MLANENQGGPAGDRSNQLEVGRSSFYGCCVQCRVEVRAPLGDVIACPHCDSLLVAKGEQA